MQQLDHLFNTGTQTPVSANLFSRNALEQSFRLLRKQYPPLALAIQNQIQPNHKLNPQPLSFNGNKLTYVRPQNTSIEDFFFVTMDAATVGEIVHAFTLLGTEYLENTQHPENNSRHREDRILLKQLLSQWVMLAEWILQQAKVDFVPRPL